MYNSILRGYKAGTITEVGVAKAVTLGWITEDQKTEMLLLKGCK
jgi:hypothetical protein